MNTESDLRTYEDLQFHQAAQIYPLLVDEEFDAFVEDVRVKGLLESIKLCDGQVIDGRNRYRAYVITKTPPNFEDVTKLVNEVGGPAEYVLSLGDKRRHMEKAQRAMCAARLLDYEKEQAKERQRRGGRAGHVEEENREVARVPQVEKGKARDAAGKRFGVGGRTVDAAAKVLETGEPEVVKAVDTGKVSISAAARIAALPKEEQPAAVKRAVEKPAQDVAGNIKSGGYWDEPRRHLDKVLALCEKNSATLMLSGTQQFRDAIKAIEDLHDCIDALEKKGKQ